MDLVGKVAILVLVFVGVCVVGSEGQTLCNMPIAGLMACRPAVTGPNPAQPTNVCCSALAKANMSCLCSYKSVMPSYGIDPKLAMQLPAKCKLTPPTNC